MEVRKSGTPCFSCQSPPLNATVLNDLKKVRQQFVLIILMGASVPKNCCIKHYHDTIVIVISKIR